MTDVPILYVAFDRPDLVRQTFGAVRKAEPRQLFVALDAPLEDGAQTDRCDLVRQLVTKVDWDCSVNFRFRDQNLGCSSSMNDAICWFFSHVEAGAIIEDDVLIGPSFLPFMSILLRDFVQEKAVSMVTGFSFLNRQENQTSFVYSRLFPIWGWGTWSDRWQRYSSSKVGWTPDTLNDSMSSYGAMRDHQLDLLLSEHRKESAQAWGSRWRNWNLQNGHYSIVPSVSLTQNLGMGHEFAVRKTLPHPIAKRLPSEIAFPLKGPKTISALTSHDERSLRSYYR